MCCVVLGVGVGVWCWCWCWFWTLRFALAPDTPADLLAPDPLALDHPTPHRPKISLFFFPSPAPFSLFLSLSLGVFSLNFVGVFEGWPSNVPVWALGQPENYGHILRTSLRKHHQNSTRRHPERDRKSKNGSGGREKKREILGSPPFGAPPFGAPPFRAPPFGAPPFGPDFFLGLGPTL